MNRQQMADPGAASRRMAKLAENSSPKGADAAAKGTVPASCAA